MKLIRKKRKRINSDYENEVLTRFRNGNVLPLFSPAVTPPAEDTRIQVTRTFLPPKQEYDYHLKGIWRRGWVTNYGPLHNKLEEKLKEYLGVRHLFIVTNGTMALQAAIKALNLKGEILTTPFSYVATTSSIVWEGCTPVFVDIQPDTFCMDPGLIEKSITTQTCAILATHVYGNPCNVERIEEIASKHKLKVIYDAAHAFGVNYKGTSVLNYGNVSTLSFHATKLFHTIEGGAIITEDDELASRLSYLINFGHDGPEHFAGLGINCKNSEFHTAIGLSVLPRVDILIRRRREITNLYDGYLKGCGLIRPFVSDDVEYNFAYYPVLFSSEKTLLKVRDALNQQNIFPRRYFYPSLTKLPYITGQHAKVAEDISTRILCLPMYFELHDEMVAKIAHIIRGSL